MQQHVEDTIIILNYVTAPHPWYRQCYMLVPRETLMEGYLGTKMYKRGAEQNRRRLVVNVARVDSGT